MRDTPGVFLLSMKDLVSLASLKHVYASSNRSCAMRLRNALKRMQRVLGMKGAPSYFLQNHIASLVLQNIPPFLGTRVDAVPTRDLVRPDLHARWLVHTHRYAQRLAIQEP